MQVAKPRAIVRTRRGTKWANQDVLLGLMMLTPALAILAAVMLYPAVVAIQSSFYRIDTVTRAETFVGLRNYQNLLVDPMFWSSLQRTAVWVVGAILSQAVAGIVIALVLDLSLRGRSFVRGLVLFPYFVPAIVAVLTWRWIFSDTVGVANYLLVDVTRILKGPIPWFEPTFAMFTVVIMSLWKYSPYWALLILARLQVIPTDLYEAAQMDGASWWLQFRYITLPWIMPVLVVILILRGIWAFNEFDMVYLPAGGGPLYATTTIAVYIRQVAFDLLNIGAASAVAIVMLGILICLTAVYFQVYRRAEQSLS
ncbi:MAG: sugar ABC transporter permease [Chloroflexi bacterium]|nr:sugar ABC transporter permease [Chloroflexota bacterium]